MKKFIFPILKLIKISQFTFQSYVNVMIIVT